MELRKDALEELWKKFSKIEGSLYEVSRGCPQRVFEGILRGGPAGGIPGITSSSDRNFFSTEVLRTPNKEVPERIPTVTPQERIPKIFVIVSFVLIRNY